MSNVLHFGDPLLRNTPDHALELFNRWSKAANGMPSDAVLAAAVNALINALRQSHGRRSEVEARFDEIMGKGKAALLKHYDATTGRRVSTIPFNQVIGVPRFDVKTGKTIG